MKRKFWNWVRNEADGERTLVLNGEISDETWYGDEVTPALFRKELAETDEEFASLQLFSQELQIRAQGIDNYVADAILEEDYLYDQGYSSGGKPIGRITLVEVERTPGTKVADEQGDGTHGNQLSEHTRQ